MNWCCRLGEGGLPGGSKKKQLDDKEVYQDLRRGVEDSFDKVTKKVKRKLRLL